MKTKHGRRWIALLTCTLVLGVAVSAWICTPTSRINRANYGLIQPRMTEADVRDILGKPWEDKLLDPDRLSESAELEALAVEFGNQALAGHDGVYVRLWIADDVQICVALPTLAAGYFQRQQLHK
jgi:hypothetical protein